MISNHSISSALVTVTKFAEIKTLFTPVKENSCCANGQFSASEGLLYVILPSFSNKMLQTNFNAAGFGVDSAYTLTGIFTGEDSNVIIDDYDFEDPPRRIDKL